MDNQRPVLSICIPTDGNVKWMIPTLDNIYSQECDMSLYEVIITDNGKSKELEEKLKQYKYPNLHYIKTQDEGFSNIITSLKSGSGLYCKMLNHRSILLPGVITRWIEIIKKYIEEKPTIYFTDGVLGKYQYKECLNFENFVREMSYWSSWSAGIGIWDIDKDSLDSIEYNKMFPNTSILFETRQNGKYVIWNEKYQLMQDDSGKGGYNLFKTFAVDYLDIINDLRQKGRISISTFIFIKNALYSFLKEWYYKTIIKANNYTFENTNISLYISVYYTKYVYIKLKYTSIYNYLNDIIKTTIIKIIYSIK